MAMPMEEMHYPEDDARQLKAAEEIKANPKRHNAARAHLKKEHIATARALGETAKPPLTKKSPIPRKSAKAKPRVGKAKPPWMANK
jgi:hypothetical protein